MMKKAVTVIMAAIMLCLGMTSALTSCKKAEEEQTTETVSDTVAVEENKLEKILLVRSADASERTVKLLYGAKELIESKTGIAAEVVDDSTPYEAKDKHFYVIFGQTKYEQSRAVGEGAEDKKLYYKMTDDSVALYAKTEQLLFVAAEKLFADCVTDGAFEIPSKYKALTVNASDCVRVGWGLHFPAYTKGSLYGKAYDTGYGLEAKKDNSYMHLARTTTKDDYLAYLKKLEKYGYKKDFENAIDDKLFASYIGALGTNIYVYYTESTRELRVIEDNVSTPLSEFNYKLDASADTRLYAFKMSFKSEDCFFIHLADNSWIVIDGGTTGNIEGTQFVKDMYNFMAERSNLAEGEKVQIACWYFTHLHSDHFFGMYGLVKEYGDKLDIHRVIDNTPADDGHFLPVDYRPLYEELLDNIRKNNPDVMYLKVHTGMVVELADTSIEVLFTHEDVITDYYAVKDSYNPNNASLISVFDIAGLTLLETADNKVYAPYQKYSLKTLTTDVLKIAHHYYDKTLDTLYKDLYNTGKVSYCYVTRRDDNTANPNTTNYFGAPTQELFGSNYILGKADKIYEFYRTGNRVVCNELNG